MAERSGISVLPLTLAHALLAGALPLPHRDPFDRLLAAQAQLAGYVMLSADAAFDGPRHSANLVADYSAACATSSPSRTPRTTYSAATLIASIMLTALALPVPAMSKAVP